MRQASSSLLDANIKLQEYIFWNGSDEEIDGICIGKNYRIMAPWLGTLYLCLAFPLEINTLALITTTMVEIDEDSIIYEAQLIAYLLLS